jgi:hypothetical protein
VVTASGSPNALLSVQCAAGYVATGGGVYGTSAGNQYAVQESAPLNSGGTLATAGQAPTGWQGELYSTGSGGSATVYALCAK